MIFAHLARAACLLLACCLLLLLLLKLVHLLERSLPSQCNEVQIRCRDSNSITNTANNIRFFFTFYLFNIEQPITILSTTDKCSNECLWSSTHLYTFSCFCQTSSNGTTGGPFSVRVKLFWPSASKPQWLYNAFGMNYNK